MSPGSAAGSADGAGAGKKAPPRVVEVAVRYLQRGEGLPEEGRTGEVSQRQGSLEARMLLPCANPSCKKGGFLLRPDVDKAVAARETSAMVERQCAGYVGALRSERGPAPRCGNTLTATIEITYGKGA
jgi:hypothetical protein